MIPFPSGFPWLRAPRVVVAVGFSAGLAACIDDFPAGADPGAGFSTAGNGGRAGSAGRGGAAGRGGGAGRGGTAGKVGSTTLPSCDGVTVKFVDKGLPTAMITCDDTVLCGGQPYACHAGSPVCAQDGETAICCASADMKGCPIDGTSEAPTCVDAGSHCSTLKQCGGDYLACPDGQTTFCPDPGDPDPVCCAGGLQHCPAIPGCVTGTCERFEKCEGKAPECPEGETVYCDVNFIGCCAKGKQHCVGFPGCVSSESECKTARICEGVTKACSAELGPERACVGKELLCCPPKQAPCKAGALASCLPVDAACTPEVSCKGAIQTCFGEAHCESGRFECCGAGDDYCAQADAGDLRGCYKREVGPFGSPVECKTVRDCPVGGKQWSTSADFAPGETGRRAACLGGEYVALSDQRPQACPALPAADVKQALAIPSTHVCASVRMCGTKVASCSKFGGTNPRVACTTGDEFICLTDELSIACPPPAGWPKWVRVKTKSECSLLKVCGGQLRRCGDEADQTNQTIECTEDGSYVCLSKDFSMKCPPSAAFSYWTVWPTGVVCSTTVLCPDGTGRGCTSASQHPDCKGACVDNP